MIPAMPALAYPNTVRFTLTAFPYPVSPAYGKCRDNNKVSRTISGTEYKMNHSFLVPSAIQGMGSCLSSRAALDRPSDTEEAAACISPYETSWVSGYPFTPIKKDENIILRVDGARRHGTAMIPHVT